MGVFSKKKKEDKTQKPAPRPPQFSVTPDPDDKLPSSGQLHDPVLTAVREMQPYEVTNQAQTQTVSPSGALRDVFGNAITNPDLSNPARSREERPLDTIRSFEYASTGDERLRDTIESDRLGFRTRQDFVSMPRFEDNPYANESNVISFGDPNAAVDEPKKEIYFPPVGDTSVNPNKQKKKGGLFKKKG